MTSYNDQHYIAKVLQGDTNAFSMLIDRYKDMVYSLALKMTKNTEDAEEVAQDAFLKAYKSLASFKGEAKFSSWLYSIVYHACLDKIKKNTKRYQEIEINEYTEQKLEDLDGVLQQLDRKERAERIAQCLDMLPEEERAIIWLFYFEEKSLNEILEITHLSKSNVKVKLHRARKKLVEIIINNVEPELISHYGKSKNT